VLVLGSGLLFLGIISMTGFMQQGINFAWLSNVSLQFWPYLGQPHPQSSASSVMVLLHMWLLNSSSVTLIAVRIGQYVIASDVGDIEMDGDVVGELDVGLDVGDLDVGLDVGIDVGFGVGHNVGHFVGIRYSIGLITQQGTWLKMRQFASQQQLCRTQVFLSSSSFILLLP